MSNELEFTGERFVPGAAGEIWYEHWHRYHFAARLVAGRDVLDVACGEGYGSALLARNARRVTGADIAQAAIDHASARYPSIGNLEFRQADCTALPFPDACFDTVVSFETIEHITAQERFLDEARRVLRPDGIIVISCPNRVEYTDKRGVINEFHVRELYRGELAALLAPRFAHTAWYGQRPSFYSVIWAERGELRGEIFEVAEAAADTPTPGHARPLYFIVVGSAAKQPIADITPLVSVFADRDEWVYRNYSDVTRAYVAARKRDATSSGNEVELTRLAAEISRAHAEIARRASFRWWLKLPFRRLLRALKGLPPGG